MAKVFIFNVARCEGCYSCHVACKDEHCGNDWMPYARPQPETGQFWYKLEEVVRGTIPQVKVAYVAHLCNHCDKPLCLPSCPQAAIYKRADGLVIIDPAKCDGCRLCVDACPYGNIWFNENLKLAQKCTGCAHLLDRGWPIKQPRCIDACCEGGGISFGEKSEFSAEIAKAEVLNPEFGTGPNVYYLNLPKRFIAGTVYDPAAKEIIKGATCTLSGDGSGKATTDGFGDFWFEGLKVGTFSLKIEAAGKTKTIDKISTVKDVSLGDIPLS